MPTTRIRAVSVSIAASALVLSGALAGCSISRDDDPDEPAAADTPKPDPTPSDQPTAEPTPSASATPSTTAAPTPSSTPVTPAPTAEGALLTAAEMPQLNEISKWTEGRTGPVSSRPFGLCQKFDLLTIGAESAVQRAFSSGKDTAGQQVAVFPDAQNTARAGKVIEAWHRDCTKRSSVDVRPITDVAVPHGKGWWYLASYERGNDGHFHSLGVVVSGKRLTLIRMDHAGQDHNYDPGMDPMELAVKAAAAKLG